MSSKFDGLLKAKEKTEEKPTRDRKTTRKSQELRAPERSRASHSSAPGRHQGPGRPPGKRSHPDYQQVTAYIRRETHQGVKVALLQQGENQDFSELVEDLLAGWLTASNSRKSG